MIEHVSVITLIVHDQYEALRFYTEKLGLEKRMDIPYGEHGRWITIAPRGDQSLQIVLQGIDWFEGEERARKEAQVGQNPTLVFAVDNCQQTYEELLGRGLEFTQPPTNSGWGIQATTKDLYGNTLVLAEYPKHQQ
ncbi:VOC family protein [Dictyobacter kobayashii]|uniref:VOC domain-containing protein n=1 Tax=Dictyobacter kobayashii TaxID=2014872 RepID=A0A402AW94_9CHLR|nr:VOC family protein [Dictyobacter kobayashii]GCE23366.1 hypothetical protein KDK_71660 [Dictyobacter kobayashii]